MADERVSRSIAEQIEEQDRVLPVHGGVDIGDGVGQAAPEFQFEDLEASERRVDVDEPVGADEPVGGSPGYPATADVPLHWRSAGMVKISQVWSLVW